MRPTNRAKPGCRANCGLFLFALLMIPVFIIGLAAVAYLVFPPPPLNILVMGLDSRPGENAVTRSDSVILIGVNPAQLRVSMLSIPRDLFLDTLGYGMQRINTINVLGEMEQPGRGPELLSESISQNFGVRVDRTVRLDFQGFVDLIDAMGGVTIDVDHAIVDDSYPTPDGGISSIRFDPGIQAMDGERALIYVRTRHADDDYQRDERQQQVISALSQRLYNPLRWPTAIRMLRNATETNLTLWDMASLAPTVLLNAGRFERFVIERSATTMTADGEAVPNYSLITPWLEGRFR